MRWYYLALLTWIFKIILFVSIVGIPIEIYLSDSSDWFEKPFNEARIINVFGRGK